MNVELQFHRWSSGKPHVRGRDIELQEVVFMACSILRMMRNLKRSLGKRHRRGATTQFHPDVMRRSGY
jgi:hypothetical protein